MFMIALTFFANFTATKDEKYFSYDKRDVLDNLACD